jgi:hypothetical protein
MKNKDASPLQSVQRRFVCLQFYRKMKIFQVDPVKYNLHFRH